MTNEKRSDVLGSETRRDFLKTTAAGAATLASLSLARSAHAAGNQEV